MNIFGGIAKCDLIAEALVKAGREVGFKVPVVVRLEGTNVEKAREILNGVRSELPMIQTAAGPDRRGEDGGRRGGQGVTNRSGAIIRSDRLSRGRTATRGTPCGSRRIGGCIGGLAVMALALPAATADDPGDRRGAGSSTPGDLRRPADRSRTPRQAAERLPEGPPTARAPRTN